METNESFLTSPFGENYLYSINRNSFVKEPSEKVFAKIYQEKLDNEKTFYIILGTDSGLLLEYILGQEKADDTRFLFIELPHIINRIKENTDLDALPEHIQITTLDKWQTVGEAFGIELYLFKDQCQFIKSVAAIDGYLAEYSAAILAFEQEYNSFRFFTRATLAVSPFMASQLQNICENRTPASLFKNQFKEETCIILAGGPSLDEDIEWVKNNRDHLVIIAVSRIAKKLLQVNLIPHIVISVDPFEISFDVSKELLQFPSKVLFLHSNNVTPFLLAQWHGSSAYLDRRYPWDEKGDANNSVSHGPTVTNAALKAAVDMGFSNILLSGVDLCFSEKGVTHASGSNEEKVGPTLGEQGKWVKTYAGKTVETLVVFENAAKGLSQLAKSAKQHGTDIYNISPNAADIEFIDHIPVEALSFSNAASDYSSKIFNLIPNETQSEILADYNTVNKNVSKMLADIKNVKRLANKALEANQALFKEKGKESENFKFKLQMDKIEKKLDTSYKKAAKFIKNFGIDKFIASAQAKSSDEWSDSKVEETGRLYYQAYITTCETLIHILTGVLARIDSRIEEQRPDPVFEHLFTQWKKDRVYGRAGNWLARHNRNTASLKANDSIAFEELAKAFKQELFNENTKHLQRTQKAASLHGVRRKIITLFHQNNAEALTTLQNSLRIHMEKEAKAEPLFNLANAYHAILIEDFIGALHFFELLPETSIQEDELQQIVSIGYRLKNYDLAKACLTKLANLSVTYLPQLTKLLRLLGENDSAISYFEQFINEDPNNVFLWNSLGEFYFDLGVLDSAKIAFESALSFDKENKQAKEYIQQLSQMA